MIEFSDYYIDESDLFIGEDENGLPREDDLQNVLDQLDDDIGSLEALRDLLDPQWYNPEEIKKHLIEKKIWKEK